MDGIANVARQQQSQVDTQARTTEQTQQTKQVEQKVDIVKQMQKNAAQEGSRVDSKEKVEDLVKQLNDALAPISTSVKFGVDKNDIFYVSVIEADTNKMIRRWPAEKAMEFLPKMKEVTGLLFDSKG